MWYYDAFLYATADVVPASDVDNGGRIDVDYFCLKVNDLNAIKRPGVSEGGGSKQRIPKPRGGGLPSMHLNSSRWFLLFVKILSGAPLWRGE